MLQKNGSFMRVLQSLPVFVDEVDYSLILSMVEHVLKGKHCVGNSMATVSM
jgi:hypothetical protein